LTNVFLKNRHPKPLSKLWIIHLFSFQRPCACILRRMIILTKLNYIVKNLFILFIIYCSLVSCRTSRFCPRFSNERGRNLSEYISPVKPFFIHALLFLLSRHNANKSLLSNAQHILT